MQPLGVGDDFDLGDRVLAIGECESHNRSFSRDDADTYGTLDQRGPREAHTMPERERMGCDGVCAVHEGSSPGREFRAVVTQQHVRVEDGDQSSEIAVPEGGERGIDDAALARQIDGPPGRCAVDAPSCSARELTAQVAALTGHFPSCRTGYRHPHLTSRRLTLQLG